MKKDTTLERRIHNFMAQKERRHEDMRESVDTLCSDLITSHVQASLMREVRGSKDSGADSVRIRGLDYAA